MADRNQQPEAVRVTVMDTESEGFVVTKEWIHQHKTPRGGWTRDQLAALGGAWPPHAGWLRRTIGKKITPQQKSTFEGHKLFV